MVERLADGRVEFKMHAPRAREVRVVGSLGSEIEMKPSGDGWWQGVSTVAPGDHEFRYLVDQRRLVTDWAAGGVRFERGEWISLLHVEGLERGDPRIAA